MIYSSFSNAEIITEVLASKYWVDTVHPDLVNEVLARIYSSGLVPADGFNEMAEGLAESLKNAENEIAECLKNAGDLEDEVFYLEHRAETMERDIVSLTEELDELKAALSDAEARNIAYVAKIAELEHDLTDQRGLESVLRYQ